MNMFSSQDWQPQPPNPFNPMTVAFLLCLVGVVLYGVLAILGVVPA